MTDEPTTPASGGAADAAHDQLELALDMALAGFRTLDQGLELADGGLVHLLGADATGRLVLVLLVSEDDEQTATRALEALDLALEHGQVLHHHLTGGRAPALGLDPARPARLLLVGEAFDLGRLRRLGSLCVRAGSIELFELRTLRSAAGESLYLHHLAGEPQPRAIAAAPPTPPAASETIELLELLTRRMRGLDPKLELLDTPAARRWRRPGADHDAGRDLVEARGERDGTLTVRLVGGARETLRNARELDAFVERVVAAYLDRA